MESILNTEKPVVILKLDDLRETFLTNFEMVADYILEKDIKASFGINGKYLVGKTDDNAIVHKTQSWNSSGNIEIWHHGWDHSKAMDRSWYEYKDRNRDDRITYSDIETNTNYERQYKDFKRNLEIVNEVLGISMNTFGSPYNQNDETTIEVINQFPEIKVLFFPRTPVTNQFELSINVDAGRLNIENQEVGNVDYDFFKNNYKSYDHTMKYMVLQAHPGQFYKSNLRTFKKICNFLIKQGHTFMTPYEFYKHQLCNYS